jgi:hypothetical protein
MRPRAHSTGRQSQHARTHARTPPRKHPRQVWYASGSLAGCLLGPPYSCRGHGRPSLLDLAAWTTRSVSTRAAMATAWTPARMRWPWQSRAHRTAAVARSCWPLLSTASQCLYEGDKQVCCDLLSRAGVTRAGRMQLARHSLLVTKIFNEAIHREEGPRATSPHRHRLEALLSPACSACRHGRSISICFGAQ